MKKILYIDHTYHQKTKSNNFLVNFLRQHYEVEILFSESVQGICDIDCGVISNEYHAIIFFQILPSKVMMKNLKHKNIIFVPMYDNGQSLLGLDYCWKYYKRAKIINFSSTLNKRHRKMGFKTLFMKYFPQTTTFIPGDSHKMFFWQRITRININTISTILADYRMQIHLHAALDPKEKVVQPSIDQGKQFDISYSDWFESKSEMQDLVDGAAFYVAPRHEEGIGLSYLEAMAKGKIVIAHDAPVMNEYITNGETGYLLDFMNPQAIEIKNVEEMQQRIFDYCKKGREKWMNDKEKIIKFINKKHIAINWRVSLNVFLYTVLIKIPKKIIKPLIPKKLLKKH